MRSSRETLVLFFFFDPKIVFQTARLVYLLLGRGMSFFRVQLPAPQ